MAPQGYEPTDLGPKVDLSNKQVYLAQVPPDFDIKKAVFKSETEITCNDTTYFVNSSSVLADCDILNRNDDGSYTPSSINIAGLLAFTKRVPLPKVDYAKVHHPKPVVKQRPNLRMRHFASGYGASDYNISVNESTTKSKSTKSSDSTKTTMEDEKDNGDEIEETKDSGKRHKHSKDESHKKRKKDKEHKKEKSEKKSKKSKN